jgi:hypothetical protein
MGLQDVPAKGLLLKCPGEKPVIAKFPTTRLYDKLTNFSHKFIIAEMPE